MMKAMIFLLAAMAIANASDIALTTPVASTYGYGLAYPSLFGYRGFGDYYGSHIGYYGGLYGGHYPGHYGRGHYGNFGYGGYFPGYGFEGYYL